MLKSLTEKQVEQFILEGVLVLPEAFPRDIAEACADVVWTHLDEDPHNPSTWTRESYRLEKGFTEGPFAQIMNPMLTGAFDDLLGEGTYSPQRSFGGWPVSFPGFSSGPWVEPTAGWHVDGSHFHHHLTSFNQAILPIFIFTDIHPGDGGTCVAIGKHLDTARVLAESEPQGLSCGDLAQRVNALPTREVREMTGPAGSVVLLHPFMPHARSMNTSQRVRLICNPCPRFHEPMNLHRPHPNDHNAVEKAIRLALNIT